MEPGQIFVLCLILISSCGWVVTTAIRARHGYPLDKKDDLPASRQMDLLSSENGQLKAQVGRLEERIAVLERIATDRSNRLSDQIESLR